MKKNHGFNIASLFFIVVVAIVFFCAGYSIRADRFVAAQSAPAASPPTKDGNPVGYDLMGKIIFTGVSNPKKACKPAVKKTCQFEMHYAGKTPASTAAVTSPTCANTKQYCLTFTSQSQPMQIKTVDETGVPHPASGTEALTITGGTLVLAR
jgi:hypothetical protein